MAAEGAARPGSGVAGMVCSLWVLVLVSSVLALEGKREGAPGNPPPASRDSTQVDMGMIQKRPKRVKTSKRAQECGGFQIEAPDNSCAPAGELNGPGWGLCFSSWEWGGG